MPAASNICIVIFCPKAEYQVIMENVIKCCRINKTDNSFKFIPGSSMSAYIAPANFCWQTAIFRLVQAKMSYWH